MTNSKEAPQLRFRSWLVAHLVVVLGIFAAGVAAFVAFCSKLDNQLAVLAREEHMGLLVRIQLGFLPAYLLIGLGHAALSYPLRRRMAQGRRPRFLIFSALGWSLGLFVLSLGPMTLLGPGSLDNLARMCVQYISPSINLYLFEAWHLSKVFSLVLGVFALLLVRDVFGGLIGFMGRGSAWRLVALGLIMGAALGLAYHFFGRTEAVTVPKASPYPNIVIIASDSLRADHLSYRGYHRDTSPHIDRLVKESIDFEQMHVATASTLESWASILTGEWPAGHGLRYMFINEEQALDIKDNQDTLPRVLKEAGYRNVVVGDWAANSFSQVDFGFDVSKTSRVQNLDVLMSEISFKTHLLVTHYFANGLGETLIPHMRQATSYMNPERLSAEFRREFDQSASRGEPFFGVLFLACTHLPFFSSHPYNTMYCDDDYRGSNRFGLRIDLNHFIKYGFDEELPAEEKEQIIGLYDGGVRMFDDFVGEMRDYLERTGLDKNTIFIVTSDHGEDLYETGTTLGHGTNFFGGDQSTQIPFLMRLPGGQWGGRKVKGVARNVDIMPTLLGLVDASEDPRRNDDAQRPPLRKVTRDGVSLLPAIVEEGADTGVAAFAETCYLFYPKRAVDDTTVRRLKPTDATLTIDPSFDNQLVLKPEWHDPVIETKDRMMRTGRWKLIYIPGTQGPIWRFHDMIADPNQELDLASVDLPWSPKEEMKSALLEWVETGKARPWPSKNDSPRSER